jgi:hypothetical protein
MMEWGRIQWCGGSEWWDTSAADEEKIEEVEKSLDILLSLKHWCEF